MSEEGAGGGARRSGGGFPSPVPSLEQMLASSPGKTPISLLQEYGTRIGRTPGYDLLKAEGQAHQPNFTFRVTVGDVSCTGQGPSKKAAKHKAAEVALKLLKGGDMLEAGAPEEPRAPRGARPCGRPPGPRRAPTPFAQGHPPGGEGARAPPAVRV